MKSLRHLLTPLDAVSIGFLGLLIALCLVFAGRVEAWPILVALDLGMVVLIVWLARKAHGHPTKLWTHLHRWYCYPFVLFVFRQLYYMVHPIHPTDYDTLFIAVDRWIFGVDPTVWLSRFTHPALTELLQTTYFAYYILFIVVGVGVYRRYPIREFDHAAFLIVYGFYLSYLGYFLLPAVGPRFTLHDFHALTQELPGLWLTDTYRAIINAGESLHPNIPNPQDLVQRDMFPSGHTEMTLICILLGFRYRLSARWFIAVVGTLLVFATVYLRYHYVIDLIGGAAFFGIAIWTGDRFQKWWSGEAEER